MSGKCISKAVSVSLLQRMAALYTDKSQVSPIKTDVKSCHITSDKQVVDNFITNQPQKNFTCNTRVVKQAFSEPTDLFTKTVSLQTL
jgi:hypothetical protein